LLEESIRENKNENKNDDFLHYHLATTEFSMGNYDKALSLYLSILHSTQLSSTQNEAAKLKIAQIFLKKNEFEKAIEMLNFTASNIDDEGLRLSILGISYLSLQDFVKAKEIYNNPAIEQSKLVDKAILENSKKIFEIINLK
jgi:tetratricopeptide (TPR) repeat protein